MATQLKYVYTKEYITNLAIKINEIEKSFDVNKFIKSIFDSTWDDLELKQRMRQIANKLNDTLIFTYEKQLDILKEVSKSFSSFEAMFFQDFVEVYGLEDFDNSIKALKVFTIDSSSEFAIRQFILKYEDKTMKELKIWAKNENEHIRRLACEGCRPRLPWAVSLSIFKKNPAKVLEIIEILKNDKSVYVQKSVANNLNDILKDNPSLVIKFVKNNLEKTKELDWICKHASRTLLKNGDKEILKLFNFDKSSHIKIKDFTCDNSVNINENLNFSFELKSDEKIGNIRVEYIIDYLKVNKKHNKKIFMISQNEIKSKSKKFTKKQSFNNMTTRKHYIGKHYISILINGEEKIKKEFELNDTSN
ncbi:DNA alkylation repair protein [Poseidonibacter parvus]|uniref:DNA alkylation repair protein n=1 Tax=Poseidonibacter parvus TaxID=1850254 RepID=A0A1P8KKZ6_9BACT|nr:DNA alkylation repair protein [Poseidonibacter parvus]APW65232.1 DNA alkylation repair protein [Poseidonibacter parvus]